MTSRGRGTRERRGATLLLVALAVTLLVAMAGFAIDFARISAAAAQLKTLTDAAAMSAATDLKRNERLESVADARALALRGVNPVDGRILNDGNMGPADVEPGRWDFITRTFVPSSWSAANAVRATARMTASYLFVRLLGPESQALQRRSVAAIAAPLRSGCLKPWAVPYSTLLLTLGRTAADTDYRLIAEDVVFLRDNRVPVVFRVQASGTVKGASASGQYHAVKYPPVQYADGRTGSPMGGANAYRAAIADTTCTQTGRAAIGDWLDVEQGSMSGPTQQGVELLCGVTGASIPCDAAIVVPIWSTTATKGGSNVWLQILYLGAFRLTRFENGEVTGYLTALAAPRPDGGFTPFAGPLAIAALVE